MKKRQKKMEPPKLFISYSWSNSSHEEWVINLATELTDNGVDVVLDKWGLKEGHDAVVFMEKMVTDPDIKKVIIVTDKNYVEKADSRDGGVGTETQIISKEVYEDQEQDKFVAVVSEKDEEGEPYLPTYYKSRIYIDLSDPDTYGENLEKLLRWIYDEPLHVKPEIGKKPSFLENEDAISLGTTSIFRRAITGIRDNKSYASGATGERLNTFSENLERFRMERTGEEFDELVIKNIESFIPHRNELIQLITAINQYSCSDENVQQLHKFFETLIPYMKIPKDGKTYFESSFDNFKFIIHELFLYAVSIFLKFENFEHANTLLEKRYYFSDNNDDDRDVMVKFNVFREHMPSLKHRNNRLKLNRISVRADLLHDRCTGVGIEFRNLMQADFVIFMRAAIEAENNFGIWWPETFAYLWSQKPFEIFARSISKKYFDRVKVLLAIDTPTDLETPPQSLNDRTRQISGFYRIEFNPAKLLSYDKLATQL